MGSVQSCSIFHNLHMISSQYVQLSVINDQHDKLPQRDQGQVIESRGICPSEWAAFFNMFCTLFLPLSTGPIQGSTL